MGEHEFELGSGQLYFTEPDGSYSLLGHVTEVECMTEAEDNDISETIVSIRGLEASFTATAKVTKDVMLAITGIWNAVMNCCPNKRVVHLALHAKKARARKKNLNRAIRILEGIDILNELGRSIT